MAAAIGNTVRKFREHWTSGSRDMHADRFTNRQIDKHAYLITPISNGSGVIKKTAKCADK